MRNKLNKLEAFNAMRIFLEQYYEMTSSDDVGALLSIMQFLPDDTTADPAVWEDWSNAVKKTLQEREGSREYMQLKK